MLQLKIEQIALCPPDPVKAEMLLRDMGLHDWVFDNVVARGAVGVRETINEATLSFNYQASPIGEIELEVLHYKQGRNWMERYGPCVSHLGMHCSAEELVEWKQFFNERDIAIAQEVMTQSHTNPYLRENRRTYNYCIFDTRHILGVDIKMIVRIEGLFDENATDPAA